MIGVLFNLTWLLWFFECCTVKASTLKPMNIPAASWVGRYLNHDTDGPIVHALVDTYSGTAGWRIHQQEVVMDCSKYGNGILLKKLLKLDPSIANLQIEVNCYEIHELTRERIIERVEGGRSE